LSFNLIETHNGMEDNMTQPRFRASCLFAVYILIFMNIEMTRSPGNQVEYDPETF